MGGRGRAARPASVAAALVLLSACGMGVTTSEPASDTAAPSGGPSPSAGASRATYLPQRLILTPTDDPATSQTISWSHRASGAAPVVSVQAGSSAVRTFTAVRRPGTSVAHSGTTRPRYTATLDGLSPDTTYAYWISDSDETSSVAHFTTAAREMPASGWTFLALGDTQIDNATTVRGIVTQAAAAAPDAELVVQVGDVVNNPTSDAEWRDMFTAMGELAGSRNWVVSIGNHEQCVLVNCESSNAEAFRSYFKWPDNGVGDQGPTWFSTDYEGVRFVVLDAFGGRIDAQARFLEQQLRSNPQPWAIVVEHAPLYAPRPGRPNPELRELWGPIIERYDVDLVLAGHDHSYARGSLRPDGPVYVVSVSGPKFYEVSEDDWVDNGADLAVAAARTATFQVITVRADRLEYRAVVADAAPQAPNGLEGGDVLDSFAIHRTTSGKHVQDGVQ